jgi:hypothetical protein
LPAFVVVALLCVALAPAWAQPRKPQKPIPATPAPPVEDPAKPLDKAGEAAKKKQSTKTFDFTALDLNGRMRSPQLLYFLERANEELERASLEKRSFIPHMVRSMEEEQL